MQEGNYNIGAFISINIILVLLLTGFIIALIFLNKKRQLSYLQNLENLKLTHTKNLLQSQIEIQENTLLHISREIHDNINLSLTLSKLHLNTLNFTNIEAAKEKTRISIDLLSKAISDISHLSTSFNSDTIKNQGLMRAVEQELKKVKQLALYEIIMEVLGDPVFMSAEKELIIFRIIQECLNNIIKHSKATKVELILNYHRDTMSISVRDDGIGFDYDKNKARTGLGLQNIRTRALSLNGVLEVDSKHNLGTTIIITIPY